MTFAEGVLAIAGLVAITVLTRGFFFLSRRELPFPPALREGLRYAPLAAVVAVVAPELFTHQGELPTTWKEPRLWAVVASAGWYFWRRDILGTIVAGMAVLLGLRLGLGW